MTKAGGDYFRLELPIQQKSGNRKAPSSSREQTSLFIPTKIRDSLPFRQSPHFRNVMVCHDMTSVLRAISFYGEIGRRFTKGRAMGLESDSSKQQPIVYTIVLCGNKVLIYRRATEKDTTGDMSSLLGDKRLRGHISMGFGGHTTGEDRRHLTTLGILFPGIHPEIQTISALEQAQTTEWQEELGIGQNDIESFWMLGAFCVTFPPEELKDPETLSVHAVHTGIAAIAVLDSKRLTERGLYLPKHEIADAVWVPINEIESTMKNFTKRGAQVEYWTDIVVKEFLPLIQTKNDKTGKIRINNNY